MSTKKIKCPYCEKRYERKELCDHIDRKHNDLLPEEYTGTRLVFDKVNNNTKGYGVCRICGRPTKWNEKIGRYDQLCGRAECKKAVHERYKKNMIKVYGEDFSPLNDPEQQKKMLANRSISGEYRFQDGGKVGYTGSYEKKCLEFMDKVMEINSEDIMSPGPTMEYEYNGEKHMYIPDFLYIPYNLIIEVKDGGSNPNTQISTSREDSKARTIAKEKIFTSDGEYSYLRLTNNDFVQLISIFMDMKYKILIDDNTRTIRINETYISENIFNKKYSMDEINDLADKCREYIKSYVYNTEYLSMEYSNKKHTTSDNISKGIMNITIAKFNIDKCIKSIGNPPKDKSTINTEDRQNKIFKDLKQILRSKPEFKPFKLSYSSTNTNTGFGSRCFDLLYNNSIINESYISEGLIFKTPQEASNVFIKRFNKKVSSMNSINDLISFSNLKYICQYREMLTSCYLFKGNYMIIKITCLYGIDYITYIELSFKIDENNNIKLDSVLFNPIKIYDKFINKTYINLIKLDKNNFSYVIDVNDNKSKLLFNNPNEKACKYIDNLKYDKSKYNISYSKDYKIIYMENIINESYIEENKAFSTKNLEYNMNAINMRNRFMNETGIAEDTITYLEEKPKIYNKNVYNNKGFENTIYIIDLNGKKVRARARAEMLVIKDDSIYLVKGNGIGFDYKVPGGGIENSEDGKDAAIRETQEEAYINTKNVEYGGCYVASYDKVNKWVKEVIPNKYQWKDYYVEVYIGEYDGKYNGKVDKMDQEESMTKGKFIKISEVYDKLNPIHKKAIDMYFGRKPGLAEFESSIDESYIEENKVFSTKNLEYNMNKWPNQSNILFITGLSGSGKSTLAAKEAKKYNAVNIELDLLEFNDIIFDKHTTNDEGNLIIKDYMNKYYNGAHKFNIKGSGKYWNKEVNRFLKYCISIAKNNKDKKYIIEGIQLIDVPDSIDVIKSYPIIVANTSMIKSMWRAYKREECSFLEYIKSFKSISALKEYIDFYLSMEKDKNEFIKNLKENNILSDQNAFNESTILNEQRTATNETFYKIKYDGAELYEALMARVPIDIANKITMNPNTSWLPKYRNIPVNQDIYYTRRGIEEFNKVAMPTINQLNKYIKLNKIGIEEYKINANIVNYNPFYITVSDIRDYTITESYTIESFGSDKFYRITYDGDGIYQAFKLRVSNKVWFDFIKSPAAKWLSKPNTYLNGYESYFTDYGYKIFVERALPIMEKYLDNSIIQTEIYDELPARIIYKDKYQVIIDKTIMESVFENERIYYKIPNVYFSSVISPDTLIKLYKINNNILTGNIAVKIHSGELGNKNFIGPDFYDKFVNYIDGTYVETNTAYDSSRNTTKKHIDVLKQHKWNQYNNVDILDADGELEIPVSDGKILTSNLVGARIKNYDSCVVLSHCKGHSFVGYGGALKQLSIGFASSRGKKIIHRYPQDKLVGDPSVKFNQNEFLEAMGDAAKSVVDYFNGKMVFISTIKNISIDCDCDGNAKSPCMKDIGMLISNDPVAIDQAFIDLIKNSNDRGKDKLLERIKSRNGEYLIEYADKLNIGSKKYNLVNIDSFIN